jgi:hypothetical protein
MPLINTISESPDFPVISMRSRFSALPSEDKEAVISLVEAGRSGGDPSEIQLSEMAQAFVRTPEFRAMYEGVRPPPAHTPHQNPLMPVLRGLIDAIGQHQATHPPAVPPGHLQPEYGDRLGGHQHSLNPAGACPACGFRQET